MRTGDKGMKKSIIMVLLSVLFWPIPSDAAFHDGPCNHVCTTPGCVVQGIETWESQNNAACANVDMNSASSTITYVTECARLDQVGAKKQSRTALTCSSGSCSITGTFKCPSAIGFKITTSFSVGCPIRGGSSPEVAIMDREYVYGVGTVAECTWPPNAVDPYGHTLEVKCNEQAGSGSVYVEEY